MCESHTKLLFYLNPSSRSLILQIVTDFHYLGRTEVRDRYFICSSQTFLLNRLIETTADAVAPSVEKYAG